MAEPAPAPRYTVAAAMRNEGAFLIEWVCWYRMLGFDALLVASNDCTDPTPEMLNLFHDAGWLTHTTHSPDPGTPPKASAHRTIRAHPLVAATDWLLICDVDEFLVLHEGDGTIGDFMARRGGGFRGIAFHWKSFGSGGLARWSDSLVHRTFTRAAALGDKANSPFKSMFREPLRFRIFGAHSPRKFDGVWGEGDNVFVDCVGKKLGLYDPNERAQMATASGRVTHRAAQMNHYIIRWEESFALKRGNPSASAGIDRYTDAFYERYNRNDETDLSALDYRSRFDRVHAEAMAIPGMARLHHLSCAHYARRLAEAAGVEPGSDDRYAYHMDQAGAGG